MGKPVFAGMDCVLQSGFDISKAFTAPLEIYFEM
jgi:hypothetical protein